MSTYKHGSQMTKKQKSSAEKVKRAIALAMDDEDAFFGRVVKINMARAVVLTWDYKTKRHLEVQATLPNKRKCVIRVNDLVNLAPSHPNWEIQVALDPKRASELRKAGRITAELATEASSSSGAAQEDAGIEFDYEGVEETEEMNEAVALAAGGGKASKKSVEVDEEVDVDAI